MPEIPPDSDDWSRSQATRRGRPAVFFIPNATALRFSRRVAKHEEIVTIRFEDADPAGVIFYPRALALAHAVVENLIRSSPLGWNGWFAAPHQAAPLRRAEADFLQPMKVGEEFAARASVESLGHTSATFLVEFSDRSGRTAARIRTVHVLIDKRTGQPAPLTEEIRAALA